MIGEGSEKKVFILFFLTLPVFVWKIKSLGAYILYYLARNFEIIHTYV